MNFERETRNDVFGIPDLVRLKKDVSCSDLSNASKKTILKAGTEMTVADVLRDDVVTVGLYDGEHNYMADVKNDDIELVKRYCPYFKSIQT